MELSDLVFAIVIIISIWLVIVINVFWISQLFCIFIMVMQFLVIRYYATKLAKVQ